ncbi:MAG: NAD-dependent epimerase/dehydratase family protein [Magnetovibrio sp.]|nr:NAD-dependent epimerase/dehydratase family protein [Magnetovibrio sp.]
MSEIQTVFLTGVTGHLGNHVAEELIQQGYDVKALVRKDPAHKIAGVDYVRGDVCEPSSYADVMKTCQATIHAAAAVSFGGNASEHMRINHDATLNLLSEAQNAKQKRFIFVSSRGTHNSAHNPKTADETTGFIRFEDADGYMASKLQAEQAVCEAAQTESIETITVSPTAIMAGRDHKPGPAGALVRDFMAGKAKFYLDGGINIVDVHDAAKATVAALSHGDTGETYFLGGTNATMREIYQIIAEITGQKAPTFMMPTFVAYTAATLFLVIEKLTGRPAPVTPKKVVSFKKRHSYCNAAKARDVLGLPQTPLRETIKETIEFFKS